MPFDGIAPDEHMGGGGRRPAIDGVIITTPGLYSTSQHEPVVNLWIQAATTLFARAHDIRPDRLVLAYTEKISISSCRIIPLQNCALLAYLIT